MGGDPRWGLRGVGECLVFKASYVIGLLGGFWGYGWSGNWKNGIDGVLSLGFDTSMIIDILYSGLAPSPDTTIFYKISEYWNRSKRRFSPLRYLWDMRGR